MTDSQKAAEKKIADLVEQTHLAFEKGNMNASAYLAAVTGMWYHTYHMPYNNLFSGADTWLYQWFGDGYFASKNAQAMGAAIQKSIAEKEAKDAEKKKGNTSFWKRSW